MLPPVDAATLAPDEPLGFESIQQTGNARRLFDHSLRHFQRWQPVIASAAKNPEHVVLLQRDAVRLNHTRGIATHEISGSDQCKNRFLSRGSKWPRLPEFALQRRRLSDHAVKITCQ
jgi:hypothetical protein